MTTEQDGCTRTARSAGLLNLGSHKQPSPVHAACRLLPAALNRRVADTPNISAIAQVTDACYLAVTWPKSKKKRFRGEILNFVG